MENSPRAIERRGLSYATEQKVGQRLSQTGAMIKEKRPETMRNAGAKTQRGGFAVAGNQIIQENREETGDSLKNTAVKGGALLFWLVAGIAIAKDIIDIGVMVLDMLGAGLTATVLGAPVGMGILVFSEILSKVVGMFIDFTLVAYFGYIGSGFALRLVIMSVGALIDMVPIMNVLPLTTLSFFAAYLFGKTVKKSIQTQSPKAGGLVRGVSTAGKFIKKYI